MALALGLKATLLAAHPLGARTPHRLRATVTIRDVARAAGVSVATVSRAVNESHLVAGETLARVRGVASRMGYVPHGAARSLVMRRTHTIGVLLPDLYGEFFSEVIRGIDQTVRKAGYHCLVSSAQHDGTQLESALASMRGRVDGLILMSPEFTGDLPRRTLQGDFPVVLLNCPPTDLAFDSLSVANYDGAYAMVQHFIGLGHRRIAMIQGAVGNFDAAERLRGYRAALLDAGLPLGPELEVPGDFSEGSGDAATRVLLQRAERPTAIFAANDAMAIGALSALREAGVRVPEEIALGGFDDIPMARYLAPALTSVHVDISALGARTAARLLARLDRTPGHGPIRDILPTTLVVRRSCGMQVS
ncbi:MAG: LacI family DNA-binding transcriptional regulator [Gemmatimonadales bacterium]|nr:LacI family DNA-binding transcriptional regulator [Gemmatimonadales bacterium]